MKPMTVQISYDAEKEIYRVVDADKGDYAMSDVIKLKNFLKQTEFEEEHTVVRHTYADMYDCLQRELLRRETTYPNLMAQKKLEVSKGNSEISMMQDIVAVWETLLYLDENEQLFDEESEDE